MTTDAQELDNAELALLGSAILTGARGLDELDFDPSDFRAPVLEHAWRTLTDMSREGKPVDQVSVWAELAKSEMRTDPTLLHRAVEAAPSGACLLYTSPSPRDS